MTHPFCEKTSCASYQYLERNGCRVPLGKEIQCALNGCRDREFALLERAYAFVEVLLHLDRGDPASRRVVDGIVERVEDRARALGGQLIDSEYCQTPDHGDPVGERVIAFLQDERTAAVRNALTKSEVKTRLEQRARRRLPLYTDPVVIDDSFSQVVADVPTVLPKLEYPRAAFNFFLSAIVRRAQRRLRRKHEVPVNPSELKDERRYDPSNEYEAIIALRTIYAACNEEQRRALAAWARHADLEVMARVLGLTSDQAKKIRRAIRDIAGVPVRARSGKRH